MLAGDLNFIEKGERDSLKKGIAEIERMLKGLIKSLENKPLTPWPGPITIKVNCGLNSMIPSVRPFNNRFSRDRAGLESSNPFLFL